MKQSIIFVTLLLLVCSACGSEIAFCQSPNAKNIQASNNAGTQVISLKGGRVILSSARDAGAVRHAPEIGEEIHVSSSAGVLLYSAVGEKFVPVHIPADPAGDKGDSPRNVPSEYAVLQNYPNPFNPSTTFRFDLPQPSAVVLSLYNILGQEVATVVNETLPAGSYTRSFDASRLASGVYLYRLVAGTYSETKRMVLIK